MVGILPKRKTKAEREAFKQFKEKEALFDLEDAIVRHFIQYGSVSHLTLINGRSIASQVPYGGLKIGDTLIPFADHTAVFSAEFFKEGFSIKIS